MNNYQGGSQNRGGPPQNKSLEDYKNTIATSGFTSDKVMALIKPLARSFTSNSRGEGRDVTKTQLRKFYNLVKVAQTTASAQGATVDKAKVKLRTLQAQVTYAVARKTMPLDFKIFFDISVETILKNQKLTDGLNDFTTLFESLYAYFYYYAEGYTDE